MASPSSRPFLLQWGLRTLAVAWFALATGALATSADGAAPERHPELRLAVPAPDSEATGPVEVIRLVFSEAVQAPLSRIQVFDVGGGEIPGGATAHPAQGEEDQLVMTLDQALAPGRYRVDWRTATSDGHIVQGTYTFGVRALDAAVSVPPVDSVRTGTIDPAADTVRESAADALPPGSHPPSGILSLPAGSGPRWLHLIGIVLLIGAVGFRYGVVAPLAREGDLPAFSATALGAVRGVAAGGVVLLFITLLLRAFGQIQAMGPEAGESLRFLFFRTGWGAGWFLHLGVLVLGMSGVVLASPRGEGTAGWRVLALGALLLPFSLALQGHAWTVEEGRALALAAVYLHVLTAGIWLGGLWLLLAVGLPAIRKGKSAEDPGFTIDPGNPPLARMVNAFSRMALVAVLLLVATGGVQSWIHLGGFGDYFSTAWGRTLLVKLIGVGGIVLLGFYNWRKVRPALASNADPGQLRIPASVEAILGLLVLAAASVLAATPLP